MSFVIPSGLIAMYNDGIDAVMTFNGIDVELHYPPKMLPCVNCYQSNGKSTNVYKTGGPLPFQNGTICPLCDGKGFFAQDNFDTVKMLVYFSPTNFAKGFAQLDLPIAAPGDFIQTKGYMTDFSKIKATDEMRVKPQPQLNVYRYSRYSDPIPTGFHSNRYILTLWQRVG
jgi:hypothetical protein